MIRSMTGFGRAEMTRDGSVVRTEVRTVNNRNLKVILRLPERLACCESALEKLVQQRAARGTVYVTVAFECLAGDSGYSFDVAVMERYWRELAQVREQLESVGEVTLDTLASLPGVLRKTPILEDLPPATWAHVEAVVAQALDAMVAMRAEEGAFLWKDMLERRDAIGRLVDKVETHQPTMLEQYRKRLADRLNRLMEGVNSQLVPDELAREIALFADRSDISEEISRMRSHLQQIGELDSNDGPRGRRLEFITQEMFREANTMASKAADADTVRDILDIKVEVEKLREQATNVE